MPKSSTNQAEYLILYGFATKWVSIQMFPFTTDNLRKDFLESNSPLTKPYLYGSVLSELSRLGLISYNGKMVKSKAKGQRGRMVKQWISKEYSASQAAKRLKAETVKSRTLAEQQKTLEL